MRVNQAFRYISKQFTPLLVGLLLTSGFMEIVIQKLITAFINPLNFLPHQLLKIRTGSAPIDAFILSRLEKANLSPAKPASKQALIRRVYYDLTGLPPSPQA